MTSQTHPTLLFTGRVFAEPWGGVRELAVGLLEALAPLVAEQQRQVEVLVPRTGISPVQSEWIHEIHLPQFSGNRLLWDHWTVPQYANTRSNAVLYCNKMILPFGLKVSGIVSIYDFMYFPQPDQYSWREYRLADSLYMRMLLRSTLRRAKRIHLISHHAKGDAARLFPQIPDSKFQVVHPGIDSGYWTEHCDQPTMSDNDRWLLESGVTGPFIVYAGGLSIRKNVSLLVRTFLEFRKEFPAYQLVLTGGAKPTQRDPEMNGLLAEAPLNSVIHLGFIARDQLRHLYHRSKFSVFPSLYEGFGFPPLESQAAGCPVIVSNAASLPEVVGDSAPLFDPASESELLAAMRLMTDDAARERWKQAGTENARKFPWEQSAREILKLVDEAAET